MDSGHVYEDISPCFQGEKHAKDFEIFALDNCTGVFELRQLTTEDSIRSYITTCATGPNMTQILISRHKDHTSREIRPSFPPYRTNVVKLLEACWDIPSTYMQLRTYTNACGTFQRYVRYNPQGQIKNLSFVLRVPHSPRFVKSIWSLALCWEPKLNHTFAVFDGAADTDVRTLQAYLDSRPQLQSHPLTLPAILTDVLGRYKITARNRYERMLFQLEIDLGITRGSAAVLRGAEQQLSRELGENTAKCNQLITSIVYLERGQVFIRDIAESLRQELLMEYSLEQAMDKDAWQRFNLASYEIRDIVRNCHDLAVGSIHQASCLEKRAQMLLTVIYILIAQKDNRLSIEIATAAKRDSSIVTAIGVITMIFLPATFVTSLFGMNFFAFDAQAQSLAVAKTFWLYWTITLPLTAIVLLSFLCWMVWSHHLRRQNQQERQQSTVASVPNLDQNPDPRARLLDELQPTPESFGPCYPPVRVK